MCYHSTYRHTDYYLIKVVLYYSWFKYEKQLYHLTTRMGFEPTQLSPNGLAVHRLNHSATSSMCYHKKAKLFETFDLFLIYEIYVRFV